MAQLDQNGTSNEFTAILPNVGIIPFNDVESATELDDLYQRLVPYETDSGYGYNPYFRNGGNWFAAAIKRQRRAEIKALRNVSLDISAALDLPVELLLEIFEFLHPIDLYSTVRSAKKLRGILLDRRASAVWKGAFARCADVLPPCPLDVSEPQWASMLFGPATCDDCGRKGAMIDFHVRWRFCQLCMDNVYVDKSRLDPDGSWSTRSQDLNAFWKCIPPTYRRDSRFYPNVWEYDDEPCYLKRDISKMIARFSTFISDLDSPGMDLAFEEFTLSAVNRTIRRLEESKKADACMVGMSSWVWEEYESNMKKLVDRYISVLLRRGHKQVDLDSTFDQIFPRYLYEERFKFNYRFYKKLALDVLRTSEAHKVRRLEEQRRWLVSERKKLVNDLYITHQKTLPAISWPNLPNEQAIYEYSPFAAFIGSESKYVGELPEESLQSHLLPFLHSWTQARASALYSRLTSREVNLELVVNVFSCPDCRDDWTRRSTAILVGLKDLRSHFKCLHPLEFSSAGRASVLALLDLLDMDSETATVESLDARDARFLCESCDTSWDRGVKGRRALTWRECIFHAIEMENTGSHGTPSWGLLTAEATESIRRREQPYPNPEYDIWCCNHCPAHYEEATTKANAFRHAREVHSIDRPRVNFDVVYDRRKLIVCRKPISVGYDPPEIYHCGKCPDTINRLWQLERLKRHLLDKHEITKPVPRHWREVKIIEKSVRAGMHELAKLQT